MSRVCENADHEGGRLVQKADLWERRIEWRRLTDQGRALVRITRRECRWCADREAHPDRYEGQQEQLT